MMAWWERAKVGDKVVCARSVNLGGGGELGSLYGVDEGSTYTIHDIYVPTSPFHVIGCPIFLRFDEILACGFAASCFRPAQPTETGMKILRGLLNPAKQPVKEDV